MIACRTLFGADVVLSADFLDYLQPGGAKAAYRRCARETHPDMLPAADTADRQRATHRFRQVNEAYRLLDAYLKERDHGQSAELPAADSAAQPAAGAPTPAPTGHYYSGPLPPKPLEFGRYLFYRGKVSFQTLHEALFFQRRQRPKFGSIALRWGWLNEDAAKRLVAPGKVFMRIGEREVKHNLLSPRQVTTLLMYQRSQQTRLGELLVERGCFCHAELELLLAEYRLHNWQYRTADGQPHR
ncbi:MAG: J domain-containing protein [Desulfuromonadales bacterium]|nr:J domain-containing protein [Desulfuromonadales bacterium]